MKRYLAVAAAITLIATAATVAAQAPGWKQRIDRSTSATDPDPAGEVKFMAMAGGFQRRILRLRFSGARRTARAGITR